ncbi:MAG: outer rane efflux protein [Phycisphaerales bacterium]|nr:outer rane efflux protein [Phycisphaerales bacterium]
MINTVTRASRPCERRDHLKGFYRRTFRLRLHRAWVSRPCHPKRSLVFASVAILALSFFLAGCTVHPPGESEERNAARAAGTPFVHRQAQPLPERPTEDDMVRRAMESNPELEQKYWEWRAAIEQIPQDGTQSTNLALFAGLGITNGSTRLDSTTLGLGNDPMADIVLPPKLSTAARRALENARAAGLRFRKTQFELRAKVLNAYADYALTAEMLRLEEAIARLLETAVTAVEAKNRAGAGGQQDVLRARNELGLAQNDVANLQSQLPAGRAALNALLDRPVDAPIPVPDTMPMSAPVSQSDGEVLELAASRNPEWSALAREVSAHEDGLRLARLQYLPDVSLSANTDLTGVTQSLAGMVTVPLLRYQAIDAAVAQAQANLKATQAMRRRAGNDLAAQVVMDLSVIRDADRQLGLFEQTILPRARQAASVVRSSYETGQSSLLDLLEAQRSVIAIGRLAANLRAVREKRLADLEAITGRPIAP